MTGSGPWLGELHEEKCVPLYTPTHTTLVSLTPLSLRFILSLSFILIT